MSSWSLPLEEAGRKMGAGRAKLGNHSPDDRRRATGMNTDGQPAVSIRPPRKPRGESEIAGANVSPIWMFQSAPPGNREGNWGNRPASVAISSFNPPPPETERGIALCECRDEPRSSFNPPPPETERGILLLFQSADAQNCFNPPPPETERGIRRGSETECKAPVGPPFSQTNIRPTAGRGFQGWRQIVGGDQVRRCSRRAFSSCTSIRRNGVPSGVR